MGQTLPHLFVHKIPTGKKVLDIFEWVEKKNAEKCLGSTKFETCSVPFFGPNKNSRYEKHHTEKPEQPGYLKEIQPGC